MNREVLPMDPEDREWRNLYLGFVVVFVMAALTLRYLVP